MPRWDFAYNLPQGGINGTEVDLLEVFYPRKDYSPGKTIDQIANLLIGRSFQPDERQRMMDLITDSQSDVSDDLRTFVSILLASPHFQWY